MPNTHSQFGEYIRKQWNKAREKKGAQSGAGASEQKERAWHSVFKAHSKVQGQEPCVKVTNVVQPNCELLLTHR